MSDRKECCLSLDVSSTKIGYCFFNFIDSGIDILESGYIKIGKPKSIVERLSIFEQEIIDFKDTYIVKKLFREEPPLLHNRSRIKTLLKIHSANDLADFICFKHFELLPETLPPQTIKSVTGLGQKMKAHKEATGDKPDKKLLGIDLVATTFPLWSYKVTRAGNPKPGTDDEADAILVALTAFEKGFGGDEHGD